VQVRVNLADDALMARMKHPEFDPCSASATFVMTLVGEFPSSGHRISTPTA
jgi:hypothetical protein